MRRQLNKYSTYHPNVSAYSVCDKLDLQSLATCLILTEREFTKSIVIATIPRIVSRYQTFVVNVKISLIVSLHFSMYGNQCLIDYILNIKFIKYFINAR